MNILKILDRILTVSLIVLLIVFIFVFNHTIVNGDSMKNTYETGNKLLINLVDRGYKRQDIVTVFSDDNGAGLIPNSINTIFQAYYNQRIILVKRVIAVGGEEIEMVDKKIIIYTQENPEGKVIEEPYAKIDWTCFGVSSMSDTSFSRRKIAENTFWLMGDNRGCSQDSRFYGSFKKESILGKVVLNF